MTILLGNGDGTFTVGSSTPPIPGPVSLALGDFNDDGNADLAVTSGNDTVTILLGTGNGSFTAPTSSSPTTGPYPGDIVVGDFNGDGNQDLAVANEDNTVSILIGNGDGTFTPFHTLQISGESWGTNGTALALGDFNSDGKTDLAVGSADNSGNALVNIFLGNGDGTFTAKTAFTSDTGGSNAYSIATGDFNGDGKTDVAVYDDEELGIFLSNGDGTFTAAVKTMGSTTSPDDDFLAIGDFNGDGIPDIALADSDVTSLIILPVESTETATATLTNVTIPGSGPKNVTAAYGGDAAFGASTSSAIQLNASQIPTTLTLTPSANASSFGQQLTFTATLSPYSDQSLATNGETVQFSSGGAGIGTGTLSSGVATLNITSLPVGTDSVTASYPGDANFAAATSSAVSIVVSGGVPSVTLSPGSLTFGSQLTGSTSSSQTVTLTNTGQASLAIDSIAASGDFAETNTCGSSLAPGASCPISVTFTPTADGTRTGSLSVTDNASGSPHSVSLTGAGATVIVSSTSTGLTVSSPGGSATAPIQISAAAAFSGAVNFTCSVAYQGTGITTDTPTCSLSPTQAQVTSGSPASTTLTVSTTAADGSARLGSGFLHLGRGMGGSALAALLFFFGVPRRRWRGMALFAILSIVAAGAGLGCGGSSSSGGSGGGTGTNPGTTAGNYSVEVTASSGTTSASLTIPVSVQ